MTLLSKVASTRKEGDINERSRLEDEIIRENEAGMKNLHEMHVSGICEDSS